MYTRNFYLDKIKPFIKKPVIKVIIGMRRVGKSYFLKQIIQLLLQQEVVEKNILYIDKERLEFDFLQNYRDLDGYVDKKFSNVPGWTTSGLSLNLNHLLRQGKWRLPVEKTRESYYNIGVKLLRRR